MHIRQHPTLYDIFFVKSAIAQKKRLKDRMEDMTKYPNPKGELEGKMQERNVFEFQEN